MFARDSIYAKRAYAIAIPSVCPSVYPSVCPSHGWISQQESRAVARKPRDAAAVLFGLKFADNIHYEFKSQASKARLHSSKRTGTKQN